MTENHSETVKLELDEDALIFGFDAKKRKFVYQTPTKIVGDIEILHNNSPVLLRKGEVLKITITQKNDTKHF